MVGLWWWDQASISLIQGLRENNKYHAPGDSGAHNIARNQCSNESQSIIEPTLIWGLVILFCQASLLFFQPVKTIYVKIKLLILTHLRYVHIAIVYCKKRPFHALTSASNIACTAQSNRNKAGIKFPVKESESKLLHTRRQLLAPPETLCFDLRLSWRTIAFGKFK